jgi:hypothetical protein
MLFGLAGFLAILALLATQVRVTPTQGYTARGVVVRRIYLTKVIESVPGPRARTSVSQSVSSSGSSYAPPAPVTTHTS